MLLLLVLASTGVLSDDRTETIEGIAGLSNALRFRDEYTRKHSEHVSRLAVQIGARFGLSPDRLDLVWRAWSTMWERSAYGMMCS